MSSPSGHSSLVPASLGPVQPGERLAGRYVVERVLGSGGMGVVVAARHEQLGRTVAIKLLTISTDPPPEAVERFLREARAAASLRSEHIARVMDVGTDERGRHFIVMEHLEGEDLGAVVRRAEPLSVGQAVGYVLQACEALAEAHNQGIIHRDLKPENIFLTRRVDGSPLIKVLDFGVSKMTSHSPERDVPSLTVSGPRSLLGSPLYMSPEQIRTPSNIDPRSDVWALGVILFELLTGRRPFEGSSLPDILASILTRVPPDVLALRPDAPPALARVVARCLAKDVDSRMGSVGLLAQSLEEWAPGWARDSATRAARMSGIATQIPGSIDSDVLKVLKAPHVSPTVEATPDRAEQRRRAADGDHRAPKPELGRPGSATALLIAGVTAGLLAAGAWRVYHARQSNGAAARSAPSSSVETAVVSAGGSALPATPRPQAPGNDPGRAETLAGPARKDTTTAVAATGAPVGAPIGAPVGLKARKPRDRAVSAAVKSSRTVRRPINRLPDAGPATREQAVPLDPLEGRK